MVSTAGRDAERVQIITPPVAESDIDHDLVNLTEYISGVTGEEYQGGILGGRFGYGAEFENDVFLMHPFCWCERGDCPWCGGCQQEPEEVTHSPACYQTRLHALRDQYGGYGKPAYSTARTRLCSEMGLDPNFGSEVHCTCGAEAEARRRYDACQCDWHVGRGVFRFGEATTGPNFWHKPSGLQVRWYKWIGRDMEFNSKPSAKEWRRIFDECVASFAASPSEEK